MFKGLFPVRCELWDSAEAWWQFPNKDKYSHETISFSKEKKRLIRLIEGSACVFTSNWQNQDLSCCIQWAASGLLLGASPLKAGACGSSSREHGGPSTQSQAPSEVSHRFHKPQEAEQHCGCSCHVNSPERTP